ncbi:MAG: divergent polysaccharide deacetylase family protein, partial [Alphaproteobacteria bacterium]|nr:divergent polysaccharide deacetylase family protein [Alphaproteobacteria bacterium]
MAMSGGFVREFGRAAVIAVPLAGVLAWGWTEFQASEAAATQQVAPQNAEVASSEPIPEPQIAAPAEPAREPAGPFFGIRREGVVAAPSPVPPRPVAVANDGGWESRAIPAPSIRTGAYVAIIIDDMGMDRARAARLAALPGPLTFSYLAYAPDIDAQSRGARANGHE